MEKIEAPRVNKAMLKDFMNKNVRMLGKVLKKETNELILEAPDSGEVKCLINENFDINSLEEYAEVLGKVTNEDTIDSITYVQNAGKGINLNEINNIIKLTFDEIMNGMFE